MQQQVYYESDLPGAERKSSAIRAAAVLASVPPMSWLFHHCNGSVTFGQVGVARYCSIGSTVLPLFQESISSKMLYSLSAFYNAAGGKWRATGASRLKATHRCCLARVRSSCWRRILRAVVLSPLLSHKVFCRTYPQGLPFLSSKILGLVPRVKN